MSRFVFVLILLLYSDLRKCIWIFWLPVTKGTSLESSENSVNPQHLLLEESFFLPFGVPLGVLGVQ